MQNWSPKISACFNCLIIFSVKGHTDLLWREIMQNFAHLFCSNFHKCENFVHIFIYKTFLLILFTQIFLSCAERVPQPLQYYYENSHKQWSLMIPYHATAAIGVFLCNKWAVYAWNFGDIFIAVISRGLYGKFKRFVESVEEKLLKSPSPAGTWVRIYDCKFYDISSWIYIML